MTDFPAAMPHGSISEAFPDVFTVTGTFRFGPGVSITRNMTIVRSGGELTLMNSVRLSPEGEAELEKLGKVTHLCRIGSFHGADDPYYKDRFGVKLWAPPGIKQPGDLKADEELKPGNAPLSDLEVFAYEKAKQPEVALNYKKHGGILVTCDSYQNWTTFDGCSFIGKLMMKAMGFGPTLIGGPWTKAVGSHVKADFDRLLEADFSHLAPAHGTVLKDAAKDGLKTAYAHRFNA